MFPDKIFDLTKIHALLHIWYAKQIFQKCFLRSNIYNIESIIIAAIQNIYGADCPAAT